MTLRGSVIGGVLIASALVLSVNLLKQRAREHEQSLDDPPRVATPLAPNQAEDVLESSLRQLATVSSLRSSRQSRKLSPSKIRRIIRASQTTVSQCVDMGGTRDRNFRDRNFCSSWCNVRGKWGCGVNALGPGRAGTYRCDCTGCNGCSASAAATRAPTRSRNALVARCEDESTTSFSLNGKPASCAELKPFCNDPAHADKVRTACRRTCDACPLPPGSSSAAPTGAPRRRYSPAAAQYAQACQDTSAAGWTVGGKPATCAQLERFCNDPSNGDKVRAACPKTCGACTLAPGESRAPTPTPSLICADKSRNKISLTLNNKPASCADCASYCNDATPFGEILREHCPKTCNTCPLAPGATRAPVAPPTPAVTPAPSPPSALPDATAAPSTTPPCRDKSKSEARLTLNAKPASCADCASFCSDSSTFGQYLRDNCPATCNTCPLAAGATREPTVRSVPGCHDKPPGQIRLTLNNRPASCADCSAYCTEPTTFGEFLRENCAKTCNSCPSAMLPSALPPGTWYETVPMAVLTQAD